MDDEQNLVEEMNQQLLITVIDTEKVPELRPISSRSHQESEPANISHWSLLFKLFLAITIMGACVAGVTFVILITPTPPHSTRTINAYIVRQPQSPGLVRNVLYQKP